MTATKRLGLFAITVLAAALLWPVDGGGAVAGDADVAALYAKKCAMCHGKDGVANKMGAGSADFNDPAWQKATGVEDVIAVTRDGKNKMPAYETKLSAEEIAALAEFVLAMPAAE